MLFERRKSWLSFSLLLLLGAGRLDVRARSALLHAGEPAPSAEIVEDGHAGSIPLVKPNTVFKVPDDNSSIWNDSLRRAVDPLGENGQPIRSDTMMIQDFRKVRGFRAERYTDPAPIRQLASVLAAAEAKREGNKIELESLELSYFFSEATAPSKLPGSKGAAKPAAHSPGPGFLQALGSARIAITATRGSYDTERCVGEAAGGVQIQIFADELAGSSDKPVGLLKCERLRWRVWTDKVSGSSELALYVVADGPKEEDPLVKGHFLSHQPDGSISMMQVQARGMIFESGILEHKVPLSVDGKTLGLTKVRLRRAIFHKEIEMLSTGSLAGWLLPFQHATPPEGKENGAEHAKGAARPPAAPEPPSQTKVRCQGPCVLDLMALPRKLESLAADQEVPTAWRFEFLNGVNLDKELLPATAAAPGAHPTGTATPQGQLNCRHLCLQFLPARPAESTGQPAMLPEYAEAVAGVRMAGVKAAAAGALPTPFNIDCQRAYYDALSDALVLEGLPGTQVELKDEQGELLTRLCVISRQTQTISMPLDGPKQLKRKSAPAPAAGTAAPPGSMDLGGGELVVNWYGPFTRELILTQQQAGLPPEQKNVLSFNKNVDIRQTSRGFSMQGQQIRIVNDAKTDRTERIEGQGGVLLRMEGMQIKGATFLNEREYGEKGELTVNRVRIAGDPRTGTEAFLWQGGSAIKASYFEINALTSSLQTSGGAVIVVQSESAPTPPAKPGDPPASASMLSSLSLSGGGNRLLQCSGDLKFDGATGVLKVIKDVIIRQAGMTIVTDTLFLTMDKPEGEKTTAGKAEPAGAPPKVPGGMLISGNIKTMECLGRVEISTDTQVVHCDHLFYDLMDERSFLQTTDPKDEVRIYMREPSGSTRLWRIDHRLDFNGKTGVFTPETRSRMEPFPGKTPLLRGPAAPAAIPSGRTP